MQPHHGAKLGTRVATVVSRAIVATHQSLVGTKHKLAMLIFRAISNEISEEVHSTIGPIFTDLADKYPDDGPLYPLLQFMATERGQLQAIAGTAVSASGLLWSISQIMNDLLAPTVYAVVKERPGLLPDIGTVAQLAASNRIDSGTADFALAAQGIGNPYLSGMIDAARQYPGASDALDMLRRGVITRSEFDLTLLRNGVPQGYFDAWFGMADVPLSPADAALAVLRSEMSQAEGEKIAGKWGISKPDFTILVGNTGEPLGLMQLLEAFRRGFIDQARLDRGILQSRVRNEWIDVATKLRYAPMSISDAVNAVVQGHLTMAEGEAIAQFNGLEPGQFTTLHATAGEPLSRTEMSELVNRGEATLADFSQALRESRLKDKYIPQAELLRIRLLEPRMLSEAVQVGAVTHAYAVEQALKYGYNRTDAEALVNHGSLTKLKTYRDRVVAGVEALYEDNAIPKADAENIIKALGYEDNEVTFILEAATFRQNARLINSAITALRGKLVAHHITTNEASGYLDALGVPASQRDFLMKLWTVELAANPRTLSEAQVVKAVKLKLIDPTEGLARLEAMGYNETDATLLIEGA